jgi:primase-polymerase (primpol)-like protein
VNAAGIPDELKAIPRWVCWAYEERDGKLTKVPLNPKIGGYASSTNPATWTTFEEALAAVPRWRNVGVVGVGFVFDKNAEDRIVGVDLDHCIDPVTGELAPWAARIVEQLHSYTEKSPSGEGLHIFLRGSLPPGGRRVAVHAPGAHHEARIEMYDSGRFFTVTGDTFAGSAVEERANTLAALHAQYFPPAPEPEPQLGPEPSGTPRRRSSPPPLGAGWVSPFTDETILRMARQAVNGQKFDALWRGDITGYPSRSEADLALVRILAFWVGHDPERIDRLFRWSGLMRPKWDRADYREATIRKVLDAPDFRWWGRMPSRRPRRPGYRVEVIV